MTRPARPEMLTTPTIAARFEQVVARVPDAIAVSGDGEAMTYAQLNSAANGLARLIRAHGLPPQSRIGLQVARSPQQVVAILAILKAGSAYLPLDPAYPAERRRFMLDDSECALLLSAGTDVPADLVAGRAHVDLDRIEPPSQDGNHGGGGCRDLAYVIYTSGSTGQPKGVLVEHRGVVLLADSLAKFYEGYGIRRHYQFFSLGFDASVWETFYALLNGLELVVDARGPAQLEPDELLDMLDAAGIDSLMTTPSYMTRANPRPRPGLRTITVCGEACPTWLARDWSAHHRFVNAYGPTENTVGATMSEVDGSEETMSIGWPLAHVDVLVLDEAGEPVPPGEVGELCLAGPAVARGYQRRPRLTQSAFVPDRHSRWAGLRMYRTGDLGRMRPDGQLEFHGRLDEQIKVRGYRIEPGEIEAALRELDGIDDAVAVAFGSAGEQSLAAFLVGAAPLDADELRARLRKRLPSHMIPLRFERVDAIPLQPSGKTDRKALRARAAAEFALADEPGSAPDLDELVAEVWRDALGRDTIDDEDDFFSLGGHSVLAAEVVTRVRVAFDLDVPLRVLYEHPTLGEFRAALSAGSPS